MLHLQLLHMLRHRLDERLDLRQLTERRLGLQLAERAEAAGLAGEGAAVDRSVCYSIVRAPLTW